MTTTVLRKKALARAPIYIRNCRIDIHHPVVLELAKTGSLQGMIRIIGQNLAAVRSGSDVDADAARLFMESSFIAGAYLIANGHPSVGERYLSDAAALLPRFVPDYLDGLDGWIDALESGEMSISESTADRIISAVESAIDAETALFAASQTDTIALVDVGIYVDSDPARLFSGLQAIGFAPNDIDRFRIEIREDACLRIRDLSSARVERVKIGRAHV